jgi:hypothetical protein
MNDVWTCLRHPPGLWEIIELWNKLIVFVLTDEICEQEKEFDSLLSF